MASDSERDALKPQRKDAGDAALELAKQLIALSSAVIALSATFIDHLRPFGRLSIGALSLAWVLLIISVLCALGTISAIVQSRLKPENDWSTGRPRHVASFGKWAFVGGLILVATVGLISALSPVAH